MTNTIAKRLWDARKVKAPTFSHRLFGGTIVEVRRIADGQYRLPSKSRFSLTKTRGGRTTPLEQRFTLVKGEVLGASNVSLPYPIEALFQHVSVVDSVDTRRARSTEYAPSLIVVTAFLRCASHSIALSATSSLGSTKLTSDVVDAASKALQTLVHQTLGVHAASLAPTPEASSGIDDIVLEGRRFARPIQFLIAEILGLDLSSDTADFLDEFASDLAEFLEDVETFDASWGSIRWQQGVGAVLNSRYILPKTQLTGFIKSRRQQAVLTSDAGSTVNTASADQQEEQSQATVQNTASAAEQ
jgi:hypothetical protein